MPIFDLRKQSDRNEYIKSDAEKKPKLTYLEFAQTHPNVRYIYAKPQSHYKYFISGRFDMGYYRLDKNGKRMKYFKAWKQVYNDYMRGMCVID